MMANQTAAGVHEQHDETFDARIGIRMLLNLLPPVIGNVIRVFHLHLFYRTFPQRANRKFFRNQIFIGSVKKLVNGLKQHSLADFAAVESVWIVSIWNINPDWPCVESQRLSLKFPKTFRLWRILLAEP